MKTKPSIIQFLFLIFPLVVLSQTAASISGTMKIDTTLWESKVYLTHITTFDTMYMVSRDLIIAETDINTDGHFSFSTSFFPEDEQLYRLHIVKKNDPATSLSIGGIDENHIFVIASRSKGVFLESFSGEFPFSSINVTGSVNSVDFQRINITASYKDSTIIDGQVVKPEFISKTIDERLRLMADSLSSPITATYALYRTNFERYVLEQPDYFARHISKWDKGSLSYISHFKEKLNLPQKKSSIQWWQIIISSILFFVLGAAFSKWRVKKIHPSVDKLSLLSVQERRVFELIKRGSSNKEIAQEFNIGISTVKSHVSNIYAKLDIKSRTQAMNFKS